MSFFFTADSSYGAGTGTVARTNSLYIQKNGTNLHEGRMYSSLYANNNKDEDDDSSVE